MDGIAFPPRRGAGAREALLRLGDREVRLLTRKSRRARRITLRIDAAEDAVELVLPVGIALREGERFLAEKHDWLVRSLGALPRRVPFREGAVVPVLGVNRIIVHRLGERGDVRLEGLMVLVPGPPDELVVRLTRWLQRRAWQECDARARDKAARIGRPLGEVAVRDPRTRWGSCSPAGDLSLSWRLVMAPEAVLDYVVAHEVGHLRVRNHGPRFWTLVEGLCTDMDGAREWLRRHGVALHRYG